MYESIRNDGEWHGADCICGKCFKEAIESRPPLFMLPVEPKDTKALDKTRVR